MKLSQWQASVMHNFDVPINASGIMRVSCKLCSTFISGNSRSPANFLKHIKRKHMSIYLELITAKMKVERPDIKIIAKTSTKQYVTPHKADTSVHAAPQSSMSASPRKQVTYTYEFKIKVLEFYFRNGGEKTFGLKSKTAQRFSIDKKTINRMLCNPDMVKKACKVLNQKPTGLVSQMPTKVIKQSKQPDDNPQMTESSPTSTHSIIDSTISMNTEDTGLFKEVPVFDLPEDPDFSLLKRTINSSVGAVAGITKILLSGTKEVQKIILDECELIFECKVCKNLFRSVVNLLAHKRIYCQDEYVDVKGLFHKDNVLGLSTESNTVIVEPEPPPDSPEKKPTNELQIDQIAARLQASKSSRASKRLNSLSSSTHTGSSLYFGRLQNIQANRNEARKDCSVILKDITGIKRAVYQDFIPPNKEPTLAEYKEMLREAKERKEGVTAILNTDGIIVNTHFGEPMDIDFSAISKTSVPENVPSNASPPPADSGNNSPQEEVVELEPPELVERTVHTCPICNIQFLSMGGCIKHLLRIHKKKKHQRDRLRQVVSERTYKKMFTQEDVRTYHLKSEERFDKPPPDEVKSSDNSAVLPEPKKFMNEEPASIPKKATSEVECTQSREVSRVSSLNRCLKCKRNFLTAGALGSHIKFCQFLPLSPLPIHEMPEKKIAIQIRKDYKKEGGVVTSPAHNSFINEPIPQLVIRRSLSEEWVSSAVQKKDLTPGQLKIENELDEKMKLLCGTEAVGRLRCIPCKRKFGKGSYFRSHVAKHLGCTRFRCSKCNYRSYYRYTIFQHALTAHQLPEPRAMKFIHNEELLGEFKYNLIEKEGASGIPIRKSLRNSNTLCQPTEDDESPDTISTKEEPTLNGQTSEKNWPQQGEEPKIDPNDNDQSSIKMEVDSYEEANSFIENTDPSEGGNARLERPQRLRKSLERKDFVYEVRRPQSGNRSSDEETTKISIDPKRKSPTTDYYVPQIKSSLILDDNSLCNGQTSPVQTGIVSATVDVTSNLPDESSQPAIALGNSSQDSNSESSQTKI